MPIQATKDIVKFYDKASKDFLPNAWLQETPKKPEEPLLLGPKGGQANGNGQNQSAVNQGQSVGPGQGTPPGMGMAPGNDLNAQRVASLKSPSQQTPVAGASEANSAGF